MTPVTAAGRAFIAARTDDYTLGRDHSPDGWRGTSSKVGCRWAGTRHACARSTAERTFTLPISYNRPLPVSSAAAP